MTLLLVSFIAGVLTVAAPCILPLLPIVIGGSLLDQEKNKWQRPLIIAVSLSLSIIVFSLLLKASTALLGVPQMVWQFISAGILVLLGIHYLYPHAWEQISTKTRFYNKSNSLLGKANKNKSNTNAALTGLALGPVFSSCSPTYALIIASILPASFVRGFIYLVAYSIGLSATLLLIAMLGRSFTTKLNFLANPNGTFKRVMGVLFIIVGLSVLLGLDKKAQSYILTKGWYTPISSLEEKLR